MMYGYVPAIVAGFLLTALPNWTGRLPVVGVRLALLFGLWGLGRIALLASALIGPLVAAVIDVPFSSCSALSSRARSSPPAIRAI